jgi:hypothetical protein
VLPAAAAATLREVPAAGRHAIRRGVHDIDEVGLDVTAMDLAHLRAHDFTGAAPVTKTARPSILATPSPP